MGLTDPLSVPLGLIGHFTALHIAQESLVIVSDIHQGLIQTQMDEEYFQGNHFRISRYLEYSA